MKVINCNDSQGNPMSISVSGVGFWYPAVEEDGEVTNHTVVRFHNMPVGIIVDLPYHEFTKKFEDL